MPFQLEYLGIQRPALPAAADFLISRHARGTDVDLRQVIVVVPGGRAGRRLLELLVDDCESRRLMLAPPVIETVGRLPEQLYQPKYPFASELTQRLVWAQTLGAASAEELAPVIPRPPAKDDLARWLDLGDLLRRQHQELAADGLDFGDVAQRGPQLDGFAEPARWRALHRIQLAYLRRLDELELWDLQTARLVAVEKQECATDRDVVLIGTVDMNITLRRMLDQVAERVTGLVFAPDEWRDRFDDQGCLIPQRWAASRIEIAEQQVVLAEGPAEQAAAVRRLIASYAGKYRAEEIVVGVPDEDLVPDIERVLASAGLTSRWGPGQPLAESAPVQLLDKVASFLDHARFSDFAALMRHAEVGDWLIQCGVGDGALDELDRYQCEHFPSRWTGELLGPAAGFAQLRAAWDLIQGALRPLAQPPRPLASWTEPILRLLIEVHGHRELDRRDAADRVVLAACDAVRKSLTEQARLPAALMPVVTATTAIRWVLDDLRRETISAPAGTDAIELLGWLELPLDDAPALIVTSLNEGFVPASVNSDLFLPNSLRQRLGITDNDRRYARDAYAVSVLDAARESVHFIVARRNRDGDPLAPSRLLFATDAETAARRALQFFRPSTEPRRNQAPSPAAECSNRLVVPRPRLLAQPLTQLNVTSFRDYLACPYRFYLRHVLRLETVDDSLQELDGRAFGNLAHDVLRQFGASSARGSTDADEIWSVLQHALNQSAKRRFGNQTLPAVMVQIEQLRLRLRAFAERQAAWAAEGWRIESTEISTTSQLPAMLDVDGEPFQLRGRMDRVDVHPESGQRIIWDYKTSDAGLAPDDTHRSRDGWIDLQLPLYRHLARSFGITGSVQVGYIMLPKDTSQTKLLLAAWSEVDFAEADETARDVVRRIRRQEFWPPARIPPAFSHDLAAICQDTVLDRGDWLP